MSLSGIAVSLQIVRTGKKMIADDRRAEPACQLQPVMIEPV
jgi:hypothetical protein